MATTLKITAVGHATCLIRMGEHSFLTDPVFSQRVLGFRRLKPPGLDPATLPPLSAILISHAHYDHFDLSSYQYFKTATPIIVPKGLAKLVSRFLPNPVVEIPPWGSHRHQEIEIHAVPVRHHGCRWFPLRYRAATAYLLKSPQSSLYFAGDTGYGEHFKNTAALFAIDVALLPVGGYDPRWLKRKTKMDPVEALQAAEDLRAAKMIPLQWGIFDFFGEPAEEPIRRLETWRVQSKLSSKICILKPGESFEWPERLSLSTHTQL